MSRKFTDLLSRLRSKSFDTSPTNASLITSYQYIENFDNVTEEECIRLDEINREIYKRNKALYQNILKKMENKNAMFKINTPPIPPSKLNQELFKIYKLRNTFTNSLYQSFAINYLLNKKYNLIYENVNNKSSYDFEPYEAIELFEKLEQVRIDFIFKNNLYYQYISQSGLKHNLQFNNPPILPAYKFKENNNIDNKNNDDNLSQVYLQYNTHTHIPIALSSSAPSQLILNNTADTDTDADINANSYKYIHQVTPSAPPKQ